ncbi:MAG: glycosyltransferase family 4 protein [Muribaculaceae bacterium]|nr:glycosyltransferase family 4 protein [Muribaculaceae bacterium]
MKRRCNLQIDYYRSAAGILYMGRWMTEFMRREYPQLKDKIHHVGAGINLDYKKIRPSTEKRNNRILFVGRDFKRKGGEKVIEAFKLLKGKVTDLELHVAGPSVDPMQTPTDGYHFYGDISYDKVQELMNMCDLFCMPSYFEAYGLVFIEALVFGLPCIGRNCCEMPYFIEEGITGELVDTDDASELAGKISKILQNEDYRRNVVQRRDSYIKEYSWDAVASRMANIIG